jgi:hypothetical protein
MIKQPSEEFYILRSRESWYRLTLLRQTKRRYHRSGRACSRSSFHARSPKLLPIWLYGGVTWRGHIMSLSLLASCRRRQRSSSVTRGVVAPYTCKQSTIFFQLDSWAAQPVFVNVFTSYLDNLGWLNCCIAGTTFFLWWYTMRQIVAANFADQYTDGMIFYIRHQTI